MLARKCDRCGGLYQPKCFDIRRSRINGIVLIERDLSNMTSYRLYIDLCPSCLEKLDAWLKMKGETTNEPNDCN